MTPNESKEKPTFKCTTCGEVYEIPFTSFKSLCCVKNSLEWVTEHPGWEINEL